MDTLHELGLIPGAVRKGRASSRPRTRGTVSAIVGTSSREEANGAGPVDREAAHPARLDVQAPVVTPSSDQLHDRRCSSRNAADPVPL